jgi:hypothetical protein
MLKPPTEAERNIAVLALLGLLLCFVSMPSLLFLGWYLICYGLYVFRVFYEKKGTGFKTLTAAIALLFAFQASGVLMRLIGFLFLGRIEAFW